MPCKLGRKLLLLRWLFVCQTRTSASCFTFLAKPPVNLPRIRMYRLKQAHSPPLPPPLCTLLPHLLPYFPTHRLALGVGQNTLPAAQRANYLHCLRLGVASTLLPHPPHTQAGLRCGAEHLTYSSLVGGFKWDTGKWDAFETFMEILRARLDHPDVPPERLSQV